MMRLPLLRNSSRLKPSSRSFASPPPVRPVRSSTTIVMRLSSFARLSASVRSRSSVSSSRSPVARPSRRLIGSPDSSSTSVPWGAMTSAPFAGTSGMVGFVAAMKIANRHRSSTRCSTLRTPSRARQMNRRMRPIPRRIAIAAVPDGLNLDLLFDARGLAGQFPQVVELRAPHVAAPLHLDLRDRRAVSLEHALHAFAVRHLAHRERGVEAPVALSDHDAFIALHALAVAFLHLHLHENRVARGELGDLARCAACFQIPDDLVHDCDLTSSSVPVRCGTRR